MDPLCYLVKGKGNQNPWDINYDIGLESWYTSQVRQWSCIAGLASWKKAASAESNGQEWRKENRSTVAYQVPGDVLICLSNKTTAGTAAAIEVATWLSLQKSTVVLWDPFVFCTEQIGELNGDVLRFTTVSFMSLIVALIFETPLGMWCYFYFFG